MPRPLRKESPGKATEMMKEVEVRCLPVHEITVAENFILGSIKKKAISENYESLRKGRPRGKLLYDIKTLNQFSDAKEQLIRGTGKVGPALKELLISLPILLLSNERIVDKKIHCHHVKQKHGGVQNPVTFLRNFFRVIRARQRIKSVIKFS